MRRTLLLVLAAVVAAALPPGASAADRVVATVDAPTRVSGYAGGLVWSRRNPATGAFELMYTDPAYPVAAVPVRSRSVPFDADIGPGPDGAPWIVYSRCLTEPPLSTPLSNSAVYTQGRRCRLYRFDVTSGEERPLGPAPKRASDVLPSIWAGRVAFARVQDGRRAFPYLYEGRAGGRSPHRLPGGPRRGCSPGGPGVPRVCGDRRRSMPTALDLSGRRLALAWKYKGTLDAPASEIRLVDTRRRTSRVIDRVRGGGLTNIERVAPNFDGSSLYYARLCLGDQSGCPHRAALVRYRLATGRLSFAPITRFDMWQTRTGGETYVLRDAVSDHLCHPFDGPATAATCRIVATDPVYGSRI
jgi:hypothetical protein